MSYITQVEIHPDQPLRDYLEAMKMANREADSGLGESMLFSWYDRDRDFESPQHANECRQNSAVQPYVNHLVYHGAKLKTCL